MQKVQSLVKDFEKKIAEISNEDETLYIVNAGRMNHGKSSLFNSLLNNDAFAVGDIRTTRIRGDAEFEKDVFLVDTPGLDADDQDDENAFAAYRKAHMVVFVHTPNIGELHKDEIMRINEIANLFPNKQYFWQHFCLVFTFKEAIESNNIEDIKAKALNDIKNNCGGENFRVFLVSNLRYQKGKKSQKESLIKNSGIEEFRTFLLENIQQWKSDITEFQKGRFNVEKIKMLNKLQELRYERQFNIDKKKQSYEKEKARAFNHIDKTHRAINEAKQDLAGKERQVAALKQRVDSLKEQHQRERY